MLHARRTLQAARGWPELLARRCSTDRALSATLSNVLGSLRRLDPACTPLPANEAGAADASTVSGVRAGGPKMLLRFTCAHSPCGADDAHSPCGADDAARTVTKVISKRAYEQGPRPGPCVRAFGPQLPETRLLLFQELCWCDAAARSSI